VLLRKPTMNRIKTTTIALLDHLLPDRMKRSFFHLSFHLAQNEFQRYAYDHSFAPNMRFGLTEMANRRFSPNTIIDVGAFQGEWSRVAKSIWPKSRLFMIEPNLTDSAVLNGVARDLDACVFDELLGAHDDEAVDFYVMGSGSSILPECSSVPRGVQSRRLRRLDSLLTNIRGPAFLKIDAQGYELEILEGAGGLLPAIEAILLEVSIIQINEGAPLLYDVVSFMKRLGFVTYDLLQVHRRPLDRALNQIDLVFVRERSPLIADKRHFAK
jgi:FkbM family methyltransferase